MTDLALSRSSVASADPIRLILRAEGAVALVVALAAYQYLGYSWWLFAATFLLPDVALLGYLRNPRVGALVYNAVHTYVAAFALGLIGWVADAPVAMALAAVWAAHIGMDRGAGFGLKLARGARYTHLSPGA